MFNKKKLSLPSDLNFSDLALKKEDGLLIYSEQVLNKVLAHNDVEAKLLTNHQKIVFILLLYVDSLASGGQVDSVAEATIKNQIALGSYDHKLKLGSAIISSPDADQVVALREKEGITQSCLADLAGLSSRQLIGDYERGIKTPTPQTWTLLLLLTDNHPTLSISAKRQLPYRSFDG